MTTNVGRFKRSARRRYQQVATKTHRKGTTLDIVSFSLIGHKHTAVESGVYRTRRLAGVLTQVREHNECHRPRRARR